MNKRLSGNIIRWVYTAFLYYVFVIVFFNLIYNLTFDIMSYNPLRYDFVTMVKKMLPIILCPALICLMTESLLSMEKKWGVIFSVLHILETLLLYHLYFRSWYVVDDHAFPFMMDGLHFYYLLTTLAVSLILILFNRGRRIS